MGVKDNMNTYILQVRIHYGYAVYAVAAQTLSAAQQMLVAWSVMESQYHIVDKFEDTKISLIGVCDNYCFMANGELLDITEGDVVELAYCDE